MLLDFFVRIFSLSDVLEIEENCWGGFVGNVKMEMVIEMCRCLWGIMSAELFLCVETLNARQELLNVLSNKSF
jgi:hypothetical protein